MDAFNIGKAAAPGELTAEKKDQIIAQMQTQVQMSNMKNMIIGMQEKCFKKCVPVPGAKLERNEQTCITTCMDRYMETWDVVSKAYYKRSQEVKDLL